MARRSQIFGMNARDFERAMCALFRGQGYTVTGFAGGGMDVGLKKDGARYVARLGFWRKPEVGCTVAQALGQEIAAHGAQGGFVVTGGRFTPEARAFARSNRIELLDGDTLAALIEPPRVEPPRVEPPRVEPPRVEPPRVEPPRVEPPHVEPPQVEPPRVSNSAATSTPAALLDRPILP